MRWLTFSLFLATAAFAQLPAPNDAGVSMGHVHLMLGDADAQKKLWLDLLGAQPTRTGTLELLRLPGIYIITGKARTAPTEGTEGSTVNHVGFLVKNLADLKTKLAAARLDLVSDNAATKQIMVNLPEKVKLEFTEDANLTVPVALHHIHNSTTHPEKLRDWYVKT